MEQQTQSSFFSPPSSDGGPLKPSLLSRGEEESLLEYIKLHSRNWLEEKMLIISSSTKGLMLCVIMCYVLALMYGFVWFNWKQNLINIGIVVGQVALNLKAFKKLVKKIDIIHVDSGERLRMGLLLILLTIRFFLFERNKLLFVPTMLLYIFGGNNVYLESTMFGLIPTYYLCSLYVVTGSWRGYFHYMEFGVNDGLVTILVESFGLACCFWVSTFYLVTATGYLTIKVTKLEETRSKLEEALSIRNTFMSHISHEFRCPIQSSMGCLQLLKETQLTKKQQELIDTIIYSNSVSLLLIEDILRLVTIKHGKEKVEPKHIFKIGKALDVLDKMASNPNGVVEIETNILEKSDTSAKIQFKITDHGKGIPENLISSIFEPFVQLGNVNEAKVPSSGLGLSTVSHLVNGMKGKIDVKSKINVGSEFIVEIPFDLALEEQQEDVIQDPILELQLAVPQEQLKIETSITLDEEIDDTSIIIAEDNTVNRKVILKLLESLGQKADAVCDGEELIRKFDPKRHKIVITDMNMPVVGGVDAARELRKRFGHDFKIYLLTGNIMANEEDYSSIIDKVVIKPVSKSSLKQLIS